LSLIDITEFERRWRIFERVEDKEKPHTFSNFWNYKLKIENETNHILDEDNIERTLSKLGNILKKWDWNRPLSFEECFQRLSQSLTRISEPYNRIRQFSLKNFDKIPKNELRIIWNELGSIKESQKNLNNDQGQLIMPITKPLMILWGQTPTFDSVIRDNMWLFKYKEFANSRWNSSFWIHIMNELSDFIKRNKNVDDGFRRIAENKYGTDQPVPYGRFFDVYFYAPYLETDDQKSEPNLQSKKIQNNYSTIQLQQNEYSELVDLLNELRKNGKISAVERREIEKNWRNQPNNRDLLVKDLERKIGMSTQNKQENRSISSTSHLKKKTRL
jgi:hypothetical protein